MRRKRTIRSLAVGTALGLVLLLSGDHGARTATIYGIDPLEILNIRVKPNIVYLVDTSASMAAVPDSNSMIVGGDDPESRFYHTKLALRDMVDAYATEANIGLARFAPTHDNVAPMVAVDKGPFVYVSKDAGAASLLGVFTQVSTDTAGTSHLPAGEYDNESVMAEVYKSLNNTENGFSTPYPSGCTAGSTCRYYLKSRVFRHNTENAFRINSAAGTVTSVGNFACPAPPAGLLGDDADESNDGSETRACLAVRDETTGASAVYYFTSAVFGLEPGDNPVLCNALKPDEAENGDASSGDTVAVPACTVDNSSALRNALRLELGIATSNSGNYEAGLPEQLDNGDQDQLGLGNGDGAVTVTDTISGMRLSPDGTTPTAEALRDMLSYFTNTVFPARPAEISGCNDATDNDNTRCLQSNFVIYITDGNETCESSVAAVAAAKALYDNGNTDQDDRIQLIVIAYTGNPDLTQANNIARAGSGGVDDGTGNYTCDASLGAASTCRDAYRAGSEAELRSVVADATSVALISGLYSDQQSITESIYELVQFGKQTAGCTTNCLDVDDPETRFDSTIPIVLQSTFDMPGFVGHLQAFRRGTDNVSIDDAWGCTKDAVTTYGIDTCGDAGAKLTYRVRHGMQTTCSNECTYSELTGSIPSTPPFTPAGAIQRRIFTNPRNGTFPYSSTLSFTTGTNTTNTGQRPTLLWPNAGTDSSLDEELGILDSSLSDAELFLKLRDELDACATSSNYDFVANSHPCATADITRAKQEARQIILAYIAGAEIARNADATVKRHSTSGALLFTARSWVLAESTLAAPAVVTTPLETKPPGDFHLAEYLLYRDGRRDSSGDGIAEIGQGFGLRNPDLDHTSLNANGADGRTGLKPVMSVVYHAANDGLHAFRAGPNCATNILDPIPTGCTETGGEELWMFVPYDQLGKPRLRMTQPDTRPGHVYMLAAPVRVSDVFVPGDSQTITNYTNDGASSDVAAEGRWRTLIYFGRGIGGTYLTSLDVTSPGTYKDLALNTAIPGLVWSRGNPDTQDGTLGGTQNGTSGDYNAYLKMGETWSVPVVGRAAPTSGLGVDFALWAGSGFSSDPSAGSTFFQMDALTGAVLKSHDVGDRSGAAYENAIVASPAGYNQKELSPENFESVPNPAALPVERVYVGDVHGRLWKFVTSAVDSTVPVVFADLGADQPIGAPVALLAYDTDAELPAAGAAPAGEKPHVYVETGHDLRVASNFSTTPPFLMLGLRDDDVTAVGTDTVSGVHGTARVLFGPLAFPNTGIDAPGYRGTVQPATAFAADGNTLVGRVFFAGSQFVPADSTCVGEFKSIIFALGAASGQAAYAGTGIDSSGAIRLTDQRVMGIRTAGAQLVVDSGLAASTAPPPPTPAENLAENDSATVEQVFTLSMKYGSSICNDDFVAP